MNPGCAVVGVEPNESCTLMCGEIGKHLIEGISQRIIPGIIERHRVMIDDLVPVDSDASIDEMRRLASEHGLFVGPSSGANLVAARAWREAHPERREIVTFFCDEGEKYISDYFALTNLSHGLDAR